MRIDLYRTAQVARANHRTPLWKAYARVFCLTGGAAMMLYGLAHGHIGGML